MSTRSRPRPRTRRRTRRRTRTKKAGSTAKQYKENVSEPWFTLISLGLKTVEGRKNKGRFSEMKVGDIIEWTNADFKPRSVSTIIVRKQEYPTFKKYLETEGLDKCLPGIPSLEHGLSVYFKYYTEQDEKEYGVLAIEMKRTSDTHSI